MIAHITLEIARAALQHARIRHYHAIHHADPESAEQWMEKVIYWSCVCKRLRARSPRHA